MDTLDLEPMDFDPIDLYPLNFDPMDLDPMNLGVMDSPEIAGVSALPIHCLDMTLITLTCVALFISLEEQEKY